MSKKTVLIIILLYFTFLGDCKIVYSDSKIEYNGLLWVGLDHWTIWKYNSKDKPIPWVNIK